MTMLGLRRHSLGLGRRRRSDRASAEILEAVVVNGIASELTVGVPAIAALAELVVANADHFGRTGPYAHWNPDELTDYALGGYWALAGDPDREPLRVPGYQAQFHAGMQLAIAALAAVHEAKRTGAGQGA